MFILARYPKTGSEISLWPRKPKRWLGYRIHKRQGWPWWLGFLSINVDLLSLRSGLRHLLCCLSLSLIESISVNFSIAFDVFYIDHFVVISTVISFRLSINGFSNDGRDCGPYDYPLMGRHLFRLNECNDRFRYPFDCSRRLLDERQSLLAIHTNDNSDARVDYLL